MLLIPYNIFFQIHQFKIYRTKVKFKDLLLLISELTFVIKKKIQINLLYNSKHVHMHVD